MTDSKEKRGSPRVAADLRLYLDAQGEMVEMQLANVSLGVYVLPFEDSYDDPQVDSCARW